MNNSGSVYPIQDRMTSEDHSVYLQAVRELPRLPKDQVVTILWHLAQVHTDRIQARLLNPLREYAPDLAAALALQILHEDSSQFHFDALYSLWKTESSVAVSRAADMLLVHSSAVVRMWCATYLGTCGTSEDVPVLQSALNDHGTDEEGREVCKIAAASIQEILERNI